MNRLSQNVSTGIGAAALIAVAVFSLVICFHFTNQTEDLFSSIAIEDALTSDKNMLRPCTQEAKICPDGSAVWRTGPKCKFTPCQEKIIGGDVDEHGCLGSAGYSWCETKQKCLRNWEEKCVK